VNRVCPACGERVAPVPIEEGRDVLAEHSIGRCIGCGGSLLTDSALRWMASNELKEVFDELIALDPDAVARPCTVCTRKMGRHDLRERVVREAPWQPWKKLGLPEYQGRLALQMFFERCPRCDLVWIDKKVFGLLPWKPSENFRAEKPHEEPDDGAPADPISTLTSDAGLPFVENAPDVQGTPWLTGFSLLSVIVLAIIVHRAPEFAERLTFSEEGSPIRFLTFAWIPTPGAGRALADLYLFFLFSAGVEGELGPLGYTVLYIAACVAGALIHLKIAPGTEVRGLGSWVAAMSWFYCLRFPRARIGFRLSFLGAVFPESWIRLPPWLWFFFWVVMQSVIKWGLDWWRTDAVPGMGEVGLTGEWGGGFVAGTLAWLLVTILKKPL
jgi:hypothetical protein